MCLSSSSSAAASAAVTPHGPGWRGQPARWGKSWCLTGRTGQPPHLSGPERQCLVPGCKMTTLHPAPRSSRAFFLALGQMAARRHHELEGWGARKLRDQMTSLGDWLLVWIATGPRTPTPSPSATSPWQPTQLQHLSPARRDPARAPSTTADTDSWSTDSLPGGHQTRQQPPRAV
jgi:hypothetical protein